MSDTVTAASASPRGAREARKGAVNRTALSPHAARDAASECLRSRRLGVVLATASMTRDRRASDDGAEMEAIRKEQDEERPQQGSTTLADGRAPRVDPEERARRADGKGESQSRAPV